MTNIKKIGLSALAGALAMTSAHAGALSVTGNMEVSYTKGGGQTTTGNALGQANDLTFAGSGELDNGVTVAYSKSITDAHGFDDSELVFGNILGGTLAMTSTGEPIGGIDDVTPTAFEEANAQVGSITGVGGTDGTFGIRYTLADVGGSGFKLDYNYVPRHGTGDATGDEGFSGGAHGNEDAHDLTLTGTVPGVEGLSLGVGYSVRNYSLQQTTNETREDGTAYVTYAYGPVTVGYQIGGHNAAGNDPVGYRNTYMGISYAVNDDLSISYGNHKSDRVLNNGTSVENDANSLQLAYSMGGASIKIAETSVDNGSYVSGTGQDKDGTTLALTLAF